MNIEDDLFKEMEERVELWKNKSTITTYVPVPPRELSYIKERMVDGEKDGEIRFMITYMPNGKCWLGIRSDNTLISIGQNVTKEQNDEM